MIIRCIKLMSIGAMILSLEGCSTQNPFQNDFPQFPSDQPGGIVGGGGSDDGDTPNFNSNITQWNGEKANDSHLDVIGTDKDIYHELNTFNTKVTIVYDGNSASVKSDNDKIIINQSGAYVTVDMFTNSVSGTEIEISGKTEDGGLKIYGGNKFKLTMQGVDITSQRGPAINSQCKKRMYVHLAEGTTNRLTDCATYKKDSYYINGGTVDTEDRKGCFFSEGNIIMSGTGVMVVSGKYKHGVVTDGYFWMRPGVTLAVTEAAKNALHVKGDADDNVGVHVAGGLVYANVSSVAGKGIKTDWNVEIAGGQLELNTSGAATYDADEKDTSSAACIKADGDVAITGGNLVLKSTGTGGKGINADRALLIDGGESTITTTGGKFYYSNLTSSPKGVKAEGDITINNGKLNISVTGASDGSEGLESKATLTITGGEVYVYAYDDAINAAKAVNISGGKVYAYASNNDGIDSNGSLVISGGLVIASSTSAPESPIDCDNTNNFKINGGIVVGMGGCMQSNPSSSSSQRCVVYNGVTATKGQKICVLKSDGKPLLTYEFPRSMNSATFFFSSPDLASATYTVSSGGNLTDYTESWNGWFAGGTWSGGTQLGTFTSSSIITTIGNSSMGGGGFPGGGGGFPGGWH